MWIVELDKTKNVLKLLIIYPYYSIQEFNLLTVFSFSETKQNGRDITVVTNIPVSQKSIPSSSSASTPSTLVPEGKSKIYAEK